jgi:hypothetical protein
VDRPHLHENEFRADIFKHVKIKGSGYQLSEGWLELFGKVISPFEEMFEDGGRGERFGNIQCHSKTKMSKVT